MFALIMPHSTGSISMLTCLLRFCHQIVCSRLRILALPHMLIRMDRETEDVDVDQLPADQLVQILYPVT